MYKVQASRFRVQGSGFRVQGKIGFRGDGMQVELHFVRNWQIGVLTSSNSNFSFGTDI
jgi:hypothetical protein